LSRIKRIENLGAIVKLTRYGFDETVQVARIRAAENKWIFIQDTTLENYLVRRETKKISHIFLKIGFLLPQNLCNTTFEYIFRKYLFK